MISNPRSKKPMFVGRIYDRSNHLNGKVFLRAVEDCLEFVQNVRYLVPRLEIRDENDSVLMSFVNGTAWMDAFVFPPSRAQHAVERHALPQVEFNRTEEIRPRMRRFKADLADLVERHRYRAMLLMMRMDQPLKRQEIALLVWAARHGIDLSPHGYRESLAVVQEILMFNDEDF